MTATTRSPRKSRAKVAAPVEAAMVSLAGVGALVHPMVEIAELPQDFDVMDVPLSAGETLEIVESPNSDFQAEPAEAKVFTITGSYIADGAKVSVVVDAVAPVAFVKVGAKRVGKAHLVVTESPSGAMALTYVNRRGESRIVTEAQFIAIYRSGITTPIDVPATSVTLSPIPAGESAKVAAFANVVEPLSPADVIAEGAANIIAFTDSQNDGPTEEDMAILAEETADQDIDWTQDTSHDALADGMAESVDAVLQAALSSE